MKSQINEIDLAEVLDGYTLKEYTLHIGCSFTNNDICVKMNTQSVMSAIKQVINLLDKEYNSAGIWGIDKYNENLPFKVSLKGYTITKGDGVYQGKAEKTIMVSIIVPVSKPVVFAHKVNGEIVLEDDDPVRFAMFELKRRLERTLYQECVLISSHIVTGVSGISIDYSKV